MTVSDIVRLVVRRLEAEDAAYQIVGAIAYFIYGPTRFTQDVDFVVSMPSSSLDRLLRDLPPEFSLDPQARMELFTGTMRWVVEVKDAALKVEFFLLNDDPHHVEEFSRRRRQWLPGAEVEAWVATAEDLIVQKLRWARPKDLEDIRGILSLQASALDFRYIDSWCERHGTRARFEQLRASLPPAI